MDQDQLDEIEAISAIFSEEFSEVPLEEAKASLAAKGWADEPIAHVVHLSLQPQPDDKGQIYGKKTLFSLLRQHPLCLRCCASRAFSTRVAHDNLFCQFLSPISQNTLAQWLHG